MTWISLVGDKSSKINWVWNVGMHDFLDMPKFCGKKGSELDDLGDK